MEIALMKEIVEWATEAARQEVLRADSRQEEPNSDGVEAFWLTFPSERIGGASLAHAVALYGFVYSAAVASGQKLLAGER